MKLIFILMLANSATDGDLENAYPVWAIEGEVECQTVAQILNANSDSAYVFCVPEEAPADA